MMTRPSNKRQKREDYRKASQEQQQKTSTTNGTNDTTTIAPLQLPKKKFYRQRAHANPFSDHNLSYPTSPAEMDWGVHYPTFILTQEAEGEDGVRKLSKEVTIADIGCGFGGLLVALSPLFPSTLMIGMELRMQVAEYVVDRVAALRSQHRSTSQNDASPQVPMQPSPPGPYQNISALRTNAMKFLPNYFRPGQLEKLFLCFPDPHFKARKRKARIVSRQLVSEYGFVVRPGGKAYTITDVEELHMWMVGCFEGEGGGRELWERVVVGEGDQEEGLEERDECVQVMMEETEEGKKVGRNGGRKFVGVWRRRGVEGWPGQEEGSGG